MNGPKKSCATGRLAPWRHSTAGAPPPCPRKTSRQRSHTIPQRSLSSRSATARAPSPVHPACSNCRRGHSYRMWEMYFRIAINGSPVFMRIRVAVQVVCQLQRFKSGRNQLIRPGLPNPAPPSKHNPAAASKSLPIVGARPSRSLSCKRPLVGLVSLVKNRLESPPPPLGKYLINPTAAQP